MTKPEHESAITIKATTLHDGDTDIYVRDYQDDEDPHFYIETSLDMMIVSVEQMDRLFIYLASRKARKAYGSQDEEETPNN